MKKQLKQSKKTPKLPELLSSEKQEEAWSFFWKNRSGKIEICKGRREITQAIYFDVGVSLVTIFSHKFIDANFDNLYYGKQTRRPESLAVKQQRRAGKRDLMPSDSVAEIDVDVQEAGLSMLTVFEKLKDYIPSFIILSGGGYHVGWKLKNPVKIAKLEQLTRGLAYALKDLGADMQATDPPRVLRLPGSRNNKLLRDKEKFKYKDRPRAGFVDFSGKVYTASDLLERFPPPEKPVEFPSPTATRQSTSAEQHDQGSKLIEWLRPYWDREAIRHNLVMGTTGYLCKNRHWSDTAIRDFWGDFFQKVFDDRNRQGQIENTLTRYFSGARVTGVSEIKKALEAWNLKHEPLDVENRMTEFYGIFGEINPSEFYEKNSRGKYSPVPAKIVQHFYNKYNFVVTQEAKPQILVYGAGIYENRGEQIFREFMQRTFPHMTNQQKCEVITHVHDGTKVKLEKFNVDPYLIVLEDCIFNLQTWKTIPHSPEIFALKKLAVKYNPEATAPTAEMLIHDRTQNKKDADTIKEFLGRSLLRRVPANLQQALMLYSFKVDTGKSKLIDIFDSIHKNTAKHHSLEAIEYDKNYAQASLEGMYLNSNKDQSKATLKKHDNLNKFISGEAIAARNLYRPSFTLIPHALIVIAGNKIPEVTGISTAWSKRWVTLEIPYQIPKNQQDATILRKLQAEAEGILMIALRGLKRLLEAGRYSSEKTYEEGLQFWLRESNSAVWFFDKYCVRDPNGRIPAAEFGIKYKERCAEFSKFAFDLNVLGRELRRFVDIVTEKPRSEEGRFNVYCGIRWKTKQEKEVEELKSKETKLTKFTEPKKGKKKEKPSKAEIKNNESENQVQMVALKYIEKFAAKTGKDELYHLRRGTEFPVSSKSVAAELTKKKYAEVVKP